MDGQLLVRKKLKTLICVLLCAAPACWPATTVDIGSKRFTESYILAEILAQTIERAGEAHAHHRPGLGNTAVVFGALKSGAIELYPDYSGTIALELLGLTRVPDLADLNRALVLYEAAVSVPLGFNNSYALAMSSERANMLGIARISDLTRHPRLRLGLTHEFLSRKDGWAALREAYRLHALRPTGLDHGLAYEALQHGEVDVIDVYATDAKLAQPGLIMIADDRHFFPEYEALVVYRSDFPQRFPASWAAVRTLQGRISVEQMRAMNAAAELSRVPFERVAAEFLGLSSAAATHQAGFVDTLFGPDFWRLTRQHVVLVFASLFLSVMVGIPSGIWARRHAALRYWILGVAGVLQTVPSLALLAALIALLDRIGTVPAIAALFLYALLPIVRNTEAGLAAIPVGLKQSATALGLSSRLQLWLIDLPLASPLIAAGVRTAAVINVGTATIAAFVGAGGYGERIVAGLAVNSHALLLAGAIPAAAMALLIEWGFSALERYVLPRGIGSVRASP